jgi:hypothetical protein
MPGRLGAYSDGGVVRGLILHWAGTAWASVASPDPGSDTSLSAIDAVSASDIWAVGDYTILAAGAPRCRCPPMLASTP